MPRDIVRNSTVLGAKGATGGKDFSIAVVRHVLRNRLYLGEIEHKGQVFKGQHEPLVDPETFERVQAIMQTNALSPIAGRERAQHDYLLTGLARCQCGHALTTSLGKGNGGTYFYYRCTGLQKRVNHSCTVRQVRAEVLEDAVLSIVREAATEPSLIAEAVAEANRLALAAVRPLHDRVQGLKKEVQEAEWQTQELLTSLLASGLAEHATARKRMSEAERRLEQLRESLAAAEGELVSKSTQQLDLEVVIAALRSFDRSYQNLSADEKREFLQSMIKEVTVRPDLVELVFFEGRQAMRRLEGMKRSRGVILPEVEPKTGSKRGKKVKSPIESANRQPNEAYQEFPCQPTSESQVSDGVILAPTA